VFAVADVVNGSPVAAFLNGPVDRFSETGHHGMFLESGMCARELTAAGFVDVEEKHEHFDWCFDSESQMVRYCKLLFGLSLATEDEVRVALFDAFDVQQVAGKMRLPWSLFYACGRKGTPGG
jgi:hypothetical protein